MPRVTALAIDLGGSHVTCAVIRDASILASETRAANGKGTLAALLPPITDALPRLLLACGLTPTDCAGIVMGFAHLPVVLDGRLCTCGNLGCAESEASTAFLPKICESHAGRPTAEVDTDAAIGFAELFRAGDRGDHAAAAVLDHCRRVWSVLTVALIHAYDPEIVVFGGSVMKRAADILPGLQKYVDAHAWTPGRTVPLRASVLGFESALLGVIPLIETMV